MGAGGKGGMEKKGGEKKAKRAGEGKGEASVRMARSRFNQRCCHLTVVMKFIIGMGSISLFLLLLLEDAAQGFLLFVKIPFARPLPGTVPRLESRRCAALLPPYNPSSSSVAEEIMEQQKEQRTLSSSRSSSWSWYESDDGSHLSCCHEEAVQVDVYWVARINWARVQQPVAAQYELFISEIGRFLQLG